MNHFQHVYQQVYKEGELFQITRKSKTPFTKKSRRSNSVAVIGGALGDEGKGRVTDELTAYFLKKYPQVIHYRDNGGANAGHTVEIGEIRIALHQLGSGIMQPNCVVVLGKEMVLHPTDLIAEIKAVLKATKTKQLPATLKIEELTALSLDTHRAFEAVLKMRSTGSQGATGRGIAPAYADIIYRHPLKMRDLIASDWSKKFKAHYQLYQAWIKGMGFDLSQLEVPRLAGPNVLVGNETQFLKNIAKTRATLKPFVQNTSALMNKYWQQTTPMVFEKAQALGLDKRWGVYPDVTASNCSFDGIWSATEGSVDPNQLAVKAAVIKATYTSSVGARRLPTLMTNQLAHRIRKDANEYGATTKRPRDIAYIDLPMLSYLMKVGRVEHLALTHLDISYLDTPIKVCVAYEIDGQKVDYRPDQKFLDQVKPIYLELPSWDGAQAAQAKTIKDLPSDALKYIAFLTKSLQIKPFMLTTGPKRSQSLLYW